VRSRNVIILVIAAFLLTTTALCILFPREPHYQGKNLSEWLQSFDKTPLRFAGLSVDTNQPAAQAFLHMGSNAVPFLVRELRARDTGFRLWFMTLLNEKFGIEITPAHVRHFRAIEACFALGPTAKAAVPDLAASYYDWYISTPLRAFAIASTGSDALPCMISALTNWNPEVRIYTPSSFRYVEFNAEPAVSALVACLKDPQDYRVRCEAAMALAHIGKRPDLVLPALKQNLDDNNHDVRTLTTMALTEFQSKSPKTNR